MNILVTGATGNIGSELIHILINDYSNNKIIAAVRNIDRARKSFEGLDRLQYQEFDYEDPTTFDAALTDVDIVFLLRPPHISNIKKYYVPLFDVLKTNGINQVVLLSVQGAESSEIIPHRKIELLIIKYGFDYIFVRPSYFMQNLTTTLLTDIKKYKAIFLPSASAKFNWIDIKNIAEASAIYLTSFEKFKGSAYDLTGNENYDFSYVTSRIREITSVNIVYRPVNPLRFIFFQMKNKMKFGMIIVMCMLHYLPRVQREPIKSDNYFKLFAREPNNLDSFIKANREIFT